MSTPVCILRTNETDKLAEATGIDPIVVLTKIASWQGEEGKLSAMPTVEELKEFLKKLQVPFIPSYTIRNAFGEKDNLTVVRCDIGNKLIESSLNGAEDKGRLIKLPKESITPDEFIDTLEKTEKGLMLRMLRAGISVDAMREYIETPEDVETFLVLREISKFENSDNPNPLEDLMYAWQHLTSMKRFSDADFEQSINKGLRETVVIYEYDNNGPLEYTIREDRNNEWHIYDRNGREAFKLGEEDSLKHRRIIFGLLAINDGRAVIVEDNNYSFIVYNNGKIISMQTGKIRGTSKGSAGWRRRILEKAKKILNPEYESIAERAKKIDISTIAEKTREFGVVLLGNSGDFWNKVEKWQEKNPTGIVAYRKYGDRKVTFSKKTVKEGWIGNPFSTGDNKGPETVQKFFEWIVTGDNFGEERATSEYRKAIIEAIDNSPKNTPILYNRELHRPSHATVIGYLINNKDKFPDVFKTGKVAERKNKDKSESPIKFTTSEKSSYKARTLENADWSDITLAFAADFNTLGEKATRNAAGNKYVPFELFHSGDDSNDGEEILNSIEDAELPTKNIKLNVAGNGMQTLNSKGYTLEQVDELVYKALERMIKAGITISEVRSGGQTGVDEAAIKAAVRLGIPASVHTTSDWKFRGSSGKDILNEEQFKARFKVRTEDTFDTKGDSEENTSKVIELADKEWTREEAAKDTKTLYIFTDNTDRDSGKNKIDPNSRYAQKYGKDKHYPTVTAAVIRGLDNAFPISTQRWYHEGAKYEAGRWTDNDAEEFKAVIKEEIDAIIEEWNTGKYDRIVIPRNKKKGVGLFYGNISAIGKERTPKLFKILLGEYARLQRAVGDKEKRKNTDKKVAAWDQLDIKKLLSELLEKAVDETIKEDSKKSRWSRGTRKSTKGENKDKGVVINAALDALNKQVAEYEATIEGLDISQRELNLNPIAKLSRDFNPLERRDRVEWLSRLFSDVLDSAVLEMTAIIDLKTQQASEEKNRLELELNNGKKKNFDEFKELNEQFQQARQVWIKYARILIILADEIKGRKWVLDNYENKDDESLKGLVGLGAIIEKIRMIVEDFANTPTEDYDEDFGEGEGTRIVDAYQRVLDNFPQLIKEACSKLEWTEGFLVVPEEVQLTIGDKISGKAVVDSGDEKTSEEKLQEEELFEEDEDGNKTATGNDGWGFKIRFVDPRTTLSKEVKKLLNSLEQLDYDGEPLYDDLGNPRYVNGEAAHALLLNELADMIDADDFYLPDEEGYDKYPALQRAARKYPYITKVMDAMEENPKLIGAIFSDLNLAFISYWKLDDKGNPMPLNQSVARDSAMQGFIRNYEQAIPLTSDCIYSTSGEIIKKNVEYGITLIDKLIARERKFDVEDNSEDVENLTKVLRMLGLNASEKYLENVFNTLVLDKEEEVNNDLHILLTSISDILEGVLDESKFTKGAHLINTFKSQFKEIARIAGEVSELDNIMSFRDGDKTRYSYSVPNYIINLVKKLKSDKRRAEFLETEFKQFDWFMNLKTGEWMSDWLDLIENNSIVRDKLDMKEVISRGKIEYSDWTPDMVINILVNEYFSQGFNPKSETLFAYYNFPIFADSPVAMFIRMPREITDANGTFKDKLIPKYRKLVKLELIRMKLVEKRHSRMELLIAEGKFSEAAAMQIQNFDKKGSEFCFFPELEKNEEFKKQAQALLDKADIDELDRLIDSTILELLNSMFEDFVKSVSIESYALEFINKDIIREEEINDLNLINTREKLEEYFWNTTFASSQIIQITTTDLAFYKGGTDFQKRFKEVYASGRRLNTNVEHGRKIEKSLYIKDQIMTSSSYLGLKHSLNIGIKEGRLTEAQANSILDKLKDINVADALSFRNPQSFKSVLAMMGSWTDDMEEALGRFEKGIWDFTDFSIIWQTIKPFLFTNIAKDDGVGGKIRVPHLNKNSEFLLLAMYLTVAAGTKDSAFMVGLGNFFQNHPEIDVVLFESAVKAGGLGKVDLSYNSNPTIEITNEEGKVIEKITRLEQSIREGQFRDIVKGILREKYGEGKEADKQVEKAFKKLSDTEIFKMAMDYLLDIERIDQEEYNEAFEYIAPTAEEVQLMLEEHIQDPLSGTYDAKNGIFNHNTVHELPYSDYMLALPTPEHLIDVDEATAGSLFRNLVTANLPDNFTITILGRTLNKLEILTLYRAAITDNLLDSYEEVAEVFRDIDKLLKKLLQIIRDNPKYGDDLVEALLIVEIVNPLTGVRLRVFNLPPNLPSITNLLEELVTSSFKNKVTKQKIKGGNAILVSNVGLSRKLNVVREEGTGRVLGVECLLPAYAKAFYTEFLKEEKDKKGNIYYTLDIEKMPEELRKIIGYRIPTEDKYSMLPLIIKGFLPQLNGSAIMVAADVVAIAGSDFDKHQC